MTPTILIADDGSPAAEAALDTAASLFPGARAIVLTVRPEPLRLHEVSAAARVAVPDEVISEGAAALDRKSAEAALATATRGAERAAAAGLDAEARTADAPGSSWRAIRDVAGDVAADVIACGARRLGGVSRAMLGSTSSGLLQHGGRPVLIVHEGAPGVPGGPVVAGFDGSQPARVAIASAARLLGQRETVVVTVWESAVSHSRSGRLLAAIPIEEIREMTRDLDEFYRGVHADLAAEGAELAASCGLDARAEAFEAEGKPWRGLLAAAREYGASVVVAGSNGDSALAAALLGSNSAGLVHNADVPVLVVPGDA